MSLYDEVLVGSDGSPTAGVAVTAASRIAAGLGRPLTVVTAWYRDLADPPSRSEEATYPGGTASGQEARWAAATTSDAAGTARRHGVETVETLTPIGSAADALLAASQERPGALTVVGTVGLAERAERVLGNVPHQLTHHSDSDVLLVSSRERHDGWQRVALATDGSETAARACRRGADLAHALGAATTLLTVAGSEQRGATVLDHAATQADLPDAEHQVVTSRADTARALSEAARDFDLLVIGNKAMRGPSRLLGSTANRVTHDVPTDILLVNTTHGPR